MGPSTLQTRKCRRFREGAGADRPPRRPFRPRRDATPPSSKRRVRPRTQASDSKRLITGPPLPRTRHPVARPNPSPVAEAHRRLCTIRRARSAKPRSSQSRQWAPAWTSTPKTTCQADTSSSTCTASSAVSTPRPNTHNKSEGDRPGVRALWSNRPKIQKKPSKAFDCQSNY